MSNETKNPTEIRINEKAARIIQDLMDAMKRADEGLKRTDAQLSAYVNGLGAGMGVPDGWQLDPRSMAFIAPPAPVEPDGTEGADVAE